MKSKLFVVLAVLFFLVGIAQAQISWYVTNQRTIAWDVPTTLENGNPIPLTDTITYEVWICRETDIGDSTLWTSVGVTDQLQYTVTIPDEGNWYVGVQAIRQPAGETTTYKSTVNWSHKDGIYTPNPFGIKHFVPADMPPNLR